MEYEYDGVEDDDSRILWGRIGVFGGALLLALLLGRCTAGGGVPESDVAVLESENTRLQEANQSLQSELSQTQTRLQEALQGGGTTGTPGTNPSPGASASPSPGATGGDGPQADSTYIVQENDTLSGIASKVYGDPTKFGIIAEANNITADNPLQVGQELQIPANPDG